MINVILNILLSFYNPSHRTNGTIIDTCDVIELNYYYGKGDKLVLKQVIFREWSKQLRHHYIIDYRLYKEDMERPIRSNNSYILSWNDYGLRRKVISKSFIVTHLHFDPEIKEKEHWHYLNRRELTR